MYVDTYQNLKKAEPVFYRKDGSLTAYALHCGYVEKKETETHSLQLWCEYEAYHVMKCKKDTLGNMYWESFDTVNEAKAFYNKELLKL